MEEKNVGITSARDTGVREDSCPHSQLVPVPQHCCLPAATSEFSNQACEGLTTEKLCGPNAYLAERQPFWVASYVMVTQQLFMSHLSLGRADGIIQSHQQVNDRAQTLFQASGILVKHSLFHEGMSYDSHAFSAFKFQV